MARKLQAGTWKIAYADFITALMVLFLMLWLIGAIPESDLKGISEYFSETNQNLNQLPQNVHKQDTHLRDKINHRIILPPGVHPLLQLPLPIYCS